MKLTVTMNDGTLAGRSYDLESGFLTIGRSDTCSIRFDPLAERIASKQHAFIEAKVDGYYITDNQSTNGTYVNGSRIAEATKLNSGDTVQFGRNGSTAKVYIESAPASTETPQAFHSREDFRQYQVEKFNELAQSRPVSIQASVSQLGLGNVEAKPEPSKTGKYVGIFAALFVIGFLILIVTGLMFLSVGILPAIFAAFVAFIPACIYVLPIIWLDRYDPEPLWLICLAFFWGALVAVIVSFIINTVISVGVAVVLGGTSGEQLGQIVGGVISAPIFEEGSKGLGVVLILIFFRRYFDDILDGLVFAGIIALGFATVENVLYYGRAIGDPVNGGAALGLTFVMRGIMSPFAHVTFTSMTGIGCGISRETHNKLVKFAAPVVGYFFAVCLHAFWNGMAFLGGFGGFLIGYFLLEVPFFLIFVGFALYIMHRQNKILKEMLAIDIARGLIPEEHGKIATSAFKSSAWVLGGIFAGKFGPRSNYVRAMGKLGLSYWHIQRATKAHGQTASFQQNPLLRDEVLKWRDQV